MNRRDRITWTALTRSPSTPRCKAANTLYMIHILPDDGPILIWYVTNRVLWLLTQQRHEPLTKIPHEIHHSCQLRALINLDRGPGQHENYVTQPASRPFVPLVWCFIFLHYVIHTLSNNNEPYVLAYMLHKGIMHLIPDIHIAMLHFSILFSLVCVSHVSIQRI